ncbi:oligopeptide transport system permease protein [Gracilibacillus halotolerans]|uniref:Oligopeptide transport system permease protein n=1 Tax=Gracilibacillus halotolerans TaxID=74386 RepID=A0A841RLV5_9BACI|nr:oligopeptide ABC transporter permease [Gracilibacillus halotolerans]MBB6512603.1 oligopeptide transport system permease protein [Gracilibacillus halotolerans]
MDKETNKLPKDKFQRVHVEESLGEELSRPQLSYWKDAWIRLRKNKGAIAGLFVLTFIILLALLGPLMNDYGRDEANYDAAYLPPKVKGLEWAGLDGTQVLRLQGTSVDDAVERGLAGYNVEEQHVINVDTVSEPDSEDPYYTVEVKVDMYEAKGFTDEYFWFGTDNMGRDLWTRIWHGTQISLFIGLLAAFIDMVIGVIYGGVSGYYGGRVDNVMQRIIEVLSGIPNLVIVILMIIVLKPGLIAITIALTITGWIGMARIVRGQVLKLKGQEFILAARTLGASDKGILMKHLIPNVLSVIIINTMFTIPSAIFFESFLSFIGLGLQPPIASLGTLIDMAFDDYRVFPYMLLFPAVIISLLMIGFNVLADGLRDALDPKMRN